MRSAPKPWLKLAATTVMAAAVIPAGLRWLGRFGSRRRVVDMRTTVVVERAITEVFEFCRDFENFPLILDVLLHVEDTQDGRSHWAVRSPSGHSIEWDAVVTKYVPNSVIAWESVSGSPVRAGGVMRFAPLSPTDTRVDISLTYVPGENKLGEGLRALIGESNTKRLRGALHEAGRELSRATPA